MIAALARPGKGGLADESALTGVVQSFTLACGMLFVSLYGLPQRRRNPCCSAASSASPPATSRPRRSSPPLVLAVMAAIGRPLLFASVDPAVAAARGVPSRRSG